MDELLRRGFKVRASGRSRAKAEQLLQDRPQYKDKIDFVFADDLAKLDVFGHDTVKGVDAIVHAASVSALPSH